MFVAIGRNDYRILIKHSKIKRQGAHTYALRRWFQPFNRFAPFKQFNQSESDPAQSGSDLDRSACECTGGLNGWNRAQRLSWNCECRASAVDRVH